MVASLYIKRVSSIAFTTSFVLMALAVAAPAAEASNQCAPHVYLDAAHNPANTWANHAHPNFYWNGANCNVVRYGVSTSWGGYFETGGTSYHPSLGDGQYTISVRTLYYYYTYYTWFHCHAYWWGVCISGHYHTDAVYNQAWTGFSGSPVAKIDTTPPQVSISNIGQPKVVENGNTYVTSSSVFTLAASDASSGVAAVQWNLDGGSWKNYNGGITIEGADGAHTLGYRAIDNVGLTTTKTFALILDNTAPAITTEHPTSNSANVNEFSLETCTDNVRLTQDGTTVAEVPDAPAAPDVPLPPMPETPELPPTPEAPVAIPEAPEAPETPEVLASGADACAGQVVETNEITVIFPSAPAPPAIPPEVPALPVEPPAPPVQPPAAPPTPPLPPLPPVPAAPGLPPLPALPGSPVPLPEAPQAPETPELPALPGGATVDAQDVEFTPAILVSGVVDFVVEVDDAIVGTKLVEFLVDGELMSAQAGPDGTYTFSWDATSYSAGEHTFTIRATDRLGNVGDLSFTVVVVPQTQAGVEATVTETQADAEAAAEQAQADAEAKVEELQNTQPPSPPALPVTPPGSPVPTPPLPPLPVLPLP